MSDDDIRLSQVLPALSVDYELPSKTSTRILRDLATSAAFPAYLDGQVWKVKPPALPLVAKAIGAKKRSRSTAAAA
jgi:hypothetical protein